MTAVMAIDFLTHIIVIADCRISWSGNYPPQDFLQKVYPFQINGLLAFAGDILSAQAIFISIKKTNPTNLNDISICAKEAYKQIRDYPGRIVELLFVISSPDIDRSPPIVTNLPMNVLFEMVSPNFYPIRRFDFLRIGKAINYNPEILLENRNSLCDLGLNPSTRKFQMGIVANSIGNQLAKLGENTVGGLFSAVSISPNGVDFLQYSIGDKYKIEAENGKIIQNDLENNRRIQLQTIFEFSPNQYSNKNLRLDTPDI
jgi:hypothetical protein